MKIKITKKDKENLWDLIHISMYAFVLFVIVSGISINYTRASLMNNQDQYLSAKNEPLYTKEIKEFQDDPFIIEVYELCKNEDLFDRIECVVNEVSQYYKYDISRKGQLPLVISPSQFKEEGGVCRDIYLIYKIVFEKMGFKNKVNLVNMGSAFAHITNIIYTNSSDTICLIDGDKWGCV